MRGALRKYILVASLLLVWVLLRWSSIGSSINISFFKEHAALIHAYITHHYLFSVVAFIFFYALITLCAIPITPLLNMAAGYFFKLFWGTVYAVISATLGATGIFLTVRYLWGASIPPYYVARLERFNQKFEKHGAFYLLFLQLLPITPFSIIAIIAGISHVTIWTFVGTTIVGIIPGTAIYVFAGKSLMDINSVADIMSFPVFLGFAFLALLSLLPLVYDKIHSK